MAVSNIEKHAGDDQGAMQSDISGTHILKMFLTS